MPLEVCARPVSASGGKDGMAGRGGGVKRAGDGLSREQYDGDILRGYQCVGDMGQNIEASRRRCGI